MHSFALLLALASAPADDAPVVGLFRLSGPLGEQVRDGTHVELEDAFPIRRFALDAPLVLQTLHCGALDRRCLLRLRDWLGQTPRTATRYAVIELRGSPARTIGVYDLETGTTVRALSFRDDTGDLLLPIVVPWAIADAIRHHHRPPPPMTEDERRELAMLDHPPCTPEELRHSACPQREPIQAYPPPLVEPTRCGVHGRGGSPPAVLWGLLVGWLRRRHRARYRAGT